MADANSLQSNSHSGDRRSGAEDKKLGVNIYTPPEWAPRVYSKKTDHPRYSSLYIGRGSRHGNEARIGRDGTRLEVVIEYVHWLSERDDIESRLREVYMRNLVCFCDPLLCHGHALVYAAHKGLQAPQYWRADIFKIFQPLMALPSSERAPV